MLLPYKLNNARWTSWQILSGDIGWTLILEYIALRCASWINEQLLTLSPPCLQQRRLSCHHLC